MVADNLYRRAQIIESEIKPAGLNPKPSTFISDFILLIGRPGEGRDRMGWFEEPFHGGHHEIMPLLSFIMTHIPPLALRVNISLTHTRAGLLSLRTTQNSQNCKIDCIVLGANGLCLHILPETALLYIVYYTAFG